MNRRHLSALVLLLTTPIAAAQSGPTPLQAAKDMDFLEIVAAEAS